MKLNISADNKRVITLADADAVQELRDGFKEQRDFSWELKSLASFVASDGTSLEVLKSSHTISKNCRAWNVFSDHSGALDIWIECTVYNGIDAFYMIGAYLSDIWQIGPEDRRSELLSHMYIRKFKEV